MQSQPIAKKLHILTESETGYGILVENDAGSISPSFELNAGMLREMKEGLVDYTQPIIVYATLQKYDVENRNGRVYSKDILMREVNRYQKIIDMNASYGADHPDCVDNQTLILTNDGWKLIKDILYDEEIYTLNRETNVIELQKITKKIYEPYKGKMIKIKNRNIDLVVTPNHRFWFINRATGKGKFYTAQDIFEGKLDKCGYYLPKLGNWIGKDYETFVIKGVDPSVYANTIYPKALANIFMDDVAIDAIDFFAFMGIYLSEGACNGSKGGKSLGRRITITQKKGEKADKIRELLKRMPFKWTEYCFAPAQKITFSCYDNRLFYFLKPLGHSYTKYIPFELKQAAPHLLIELLDWFLMGDGRIRKIRQYSAKEVFSISKQLIDDLHEILIKAGVLEIHEQKNEILIDICQLCAVRKD